MRLTALVLTSLALGLTTTREAAADDIQVISILSDDAFEEAEALTVALKRAASRAGWDLDEGEYSLEVMAASFNCPDKPDATCIRKIAKKIESDHFVWGVLSRDGGELVAELHVWQDGSNRRTATARYPKSLNDADDEALQKVAARAVGELSGTAPGTVSIQAGNVNGQVFVDGKAAGNVVDGKVELELPAGEHEIRVEAEGYVPSSGRITVPPGMSVEFPLEPKPLGEGLAGPGGTDGGQSKGGPTTREILGYSALGLGGVFIITGGYFSISVLGAENDKGFEKYRQSWQRGDDACAHARRGDLARVPGAATPTQAADICDSTDTALPLQIVFYGLGVLAAGTGAYLLLFPPEEGPPTAGDLRVQPLVGRRSASVDLSVVF